LEDGSVWGRGGSDADGAGFGRIFHGIFQETTEGARE
jgi:hypothetical protein